MIENPPDERALFLAALEKTTSEEQEAFLEEACAGNFELLQRLRKLLDSHDESGGPLDSPPFDCDPTVQLPVTEKPGETIGPYKLLQQIGEGGFGVVFMAEQTEPLERRVALKIIKPGMDTRQVIARFEAERQALAMMDHPNIAKVLDAGTTDTGRPYFVMELVKGNPFTAYCDQQKLTLRQRLELFLPVCQAVQHAHQKGIIHRDIKPSNVLVAHYDDQPVPKIIDFGVAKAIEQRLTEKTMFTEFGQLLGTVEYMSPEQARMNQWDVDTRSDIYSLGVLLYELLTGETPFDRRRLRSAAFDELLQIIREEEPPRPSMRLGGSESLPSIAANRQIEPRQLSAQIHGELDWIVMKSLEKDRARRYDTASKLADDVRHFLDGDAVEACPPSALYRFRKFARRNNVAITTMAVVLAALLVGTGVATWQAVRATAERDRAIVAEAVAGAEATRSKQVAQFLKDMLASAGPSVARGRDATLLREVLSRTAERVERDLANQPDLQGDMWFTLGTTYQDIGDHRAAVTTFERAVESYRIAPGEPNAKLAIALARLGYSHSFLKDLAEGNRNAESGLEMARLGGDREALAVCLYYRALASNEFGTGSNQAVPYLEESLKLYREMGNRPIAEADCMWHLAVCGVGDDRGESLARQAHQIFYEHLGPNHPKTLGAQWALGQILLIQGKAANAEPILRSTLKTWEAIYDKDHPHRYVVRNRLALSLALQNNWDEAYEVLESAPTTTHPRELQYLDFYRDLFDLLADEGRFEDENTVLQEMQKRLDEVQSIYGPDHRFTKDYQSILTNMIARIGEEEEARQLKDLAERSESEDGSGEEETNDSHAEAAKSIGIEDVELSDSSLDD